METRRLNIRWNNKEEILLAEAWIEHSQDANIGKEQRDEIYWNKIFEDFHDRITGPARTKNMLTGKWTRMHGDCQRFNAYYKQANRKSGENEADLIETVKTVYLERVGKKFQYPHMWKILKEYPKWDAAKPIDGDNLLEVFVPDKRERPADKQRAVKKQKSVETSGSTGGSQSESVSSLVSQDYRRKCDAAQRAYEVQMEKDLAIKKCEEIKFLMIDTSNLPPHKRAFIERQQAEIIRKYQDAGADDMENAEVTFSTFGISQEVVPVSDTLFESEGDKLVAEVIRYVLFKSHQNSGCPIKRDELTQLVTKNYQNRSLPAFVLNKAFNKLSTIFGYDVKELQRVRPSSTNQNRASQSSGDAKSYIITSQLEPEIYKKHIEDETKSHLTGFAFVAIGIVHLAGGKITEETLWHHLGRLGMSQDDERHTDFGSTKQAVETLVQQRYLQKDKSNGPEGLTLYYELAERGLNATNSTSFKDCISQIVMNQATATNSD
ncbi:melanoma-associated antigen 8 isoform X1 [Tanacetum coccineum]